MSRLDLKIPPLALLLAFAAAAYALGKLAPIAALPFPGQRLAGIVAVLLGAAIAIAGVFEFHRAKTTVNPTAPDRASCVVASGIYRVSRNPMYLGMAIALTGIAALQSALSGYLLIPVFFGYLTAFQIRPEERMLLARFGQNYSDYMATVRRWL